MRNTVPLFLTFMLALAGCADTQAVDLEDSSTSSHPVESSSLKPEPIDPKPVAQADSPQETERETVPDPDAKKPEAMRTLDEMLLFFPIKYPYGDWEPVTLNYEDVWFSAEDGAKLHGWYCPAEKPRAVILFAHGNAGNLSHRAWLLSYFQKQLRVSVLIFDYRGYGRSEGIPTAEGILQDGRAASKALAEKAGVRQSDLVLMGRSLGGSVVVPLAGEINARGLILQSTFSSLKDVADATYPKLSWLVPPDKLNSAAKIGDYQGALLQSHGDADGTVPYASGKKLFDAANEPKEFVTIIGGDHNDPQSEEYYEMLEKFLNEVSKE